MYTLPFYAYCTLTIYMYLELFQDTCRTQNYGDVMEKCTRYYDKKYQYKLCIYIFMHLHISNVQCTFIVYNLFTYV